MKTATNNLLLTTGKKRSSRKQGKHRAKVRSRTKKSKKVSHYTFSLLRLSRVTMWFIACNVILKQFILFQRYAFKT